MAIQGKAARSATGASMSKYDVEVEGRLKVIESRLAEIEVKLHELASQPKPLSGSEGLDKVVAALKAQFPSKFAKL